MNVPVYVEWWTSTTWLWTHFALNLHTHTQRETHRETESERELHQADCSECHGFYWYCHCPVWMVLLHVLHSIQRKRKCFDFYRSFQPTFKCALHAQPNVQLTIPLPIDLWPVDKYSNISIKWITLIKKTKTCSLDDFLIQQVFSWLAKFLKRCAKS